MILPAYSLNRLNGNLQKLKGQKVEVHYKQSPSASTQKIEGTFYPLDDINLWGVQDKYKGMKLPNEIVEVNFLKLPNAGDYILGFRILDVYKDTITEREDFRAMEFLLTGSVTFQAYQSNELNPLEQKLYEELARILN